MMLSGNNFFPLADCQSGREIQKAFFMYRNLASLVLRQLEIFREEALHLKISLRIYSPKHLVFYYLLLTSDWQSVPYFSLFQ